jgi:hypothetical protein
VNSAFRKPLITIHYRGYVGGDLPRGETEPKESKNTWMNTRLDTRKKGTSNGIVGVEGE